MDKSINEINNVYKGIFLLVLSFIIICIANIGQFFFGTGNLGKIIAISIILILFALSGKFIFKISYKELYKELKFDKANWIDNLLKTLALLVVAELIISLIYQIDFMINFKIEKTIGYMAGHISNSITAIGHNYANTIFDSLMFATWIAIGLVAEELFFRYIFYRIFVKDENNKKDKLVFIMSSSIIFGLMHITTIERAVTSCVFGIFLAIIYIKTKNLIYTIIAHGLVNYCSAISLNYASYFDYENLNWSVYSNLFVAMLTLVILIILTLYAYLKRHYILPLEIRADNK